MSLEATIQENTTAIRELIDALANGFPTRATPLKEVVKETKPPKSDLGASRTNSILEPSPPAKAAAQEPAPTETAPVAASATYEEVKRAIFALAGKHGRETVVARLKQFGAEKGTDLNPDQYAAFIAIATA